MSNICIGDEYNSLNELDEENNHLHQTIQKLEKENIDLKEKIENLEKRLDQSENYANSLDSHYRQFGY